MSASESGGCYFVLNRSKIRVDFAEREGDPAGTMLREAQAGAYWAVRGHFTARDDPALVVMPTGSGKTAVMTLLAFGLVRERLLIVAPNRFILKQIADEFKTFRVARDVGCLVDELEAPKVHIVKHRLGLEEAWRGLGDFDMVVSTPNCAAPRYDGVCKPPKDLFLFDTIFFDEAHHWPAPTWDSLSQTFPGARIVGFTATPYRNDKKPIPGEIVYSYPLNRAIERGIYRRIEFIPVRGYGDDEAKDRRLAKRAKEVWEEDNRKRQGDSKGQPAKLLVRVARIKETEPIRKLYEELGVELEVVSSDKSLEKNLAAIEKVRENKGDGLLAVGMLGEGFDLPVLQIGVLHRSYQSFPITLQFIGRVCRMSGQQEQTAKLLAIPDDVEEHTKGLYDWNAEWADLIPNLADAAVDVERTRRRFVRDRWSIPAYTKEVSLHTLKPSFAVAVYYLEDLDVDIARNPKLSEKTTLFQSTFSRDGERRVLITRTICNPIWTTSTSLLEVHFDLHIYYQADDLLFEYTTSPGIALRIRKGFVEGPSAETPVPIPLVDKTRVEQIISQRALLAYFNVGMRRAVLTSSSIPTYKTMAGSHVENCISESDGRFFSVGHLFGRIEWDGDALAVGVSGDSGKIWAAARSHLREFTAWCDLLAETLTNDLVEPLPHLHHLMKPVWIMTLPAKPYAAEFHAKFYEHLGSGLRIEAKKVGGEFEPLESQGQCELSVATDPDGDYLGLVIGNTRLKIRYDLQAGQPFHYEPEPPYESCLVKVPEGGRFQEHSLDEYLFRFPPALFLVDGSAVVGRYYYEYQLPAYNLPGRVFSVHNWDELDCDITVEDIEMVGDKRRVKLEVAGKCCVLKATAKILRDRFSKSDGAFIFCDHGTGEIADYVAFQLERDLVQRERLRFTFTTARLLQVRNRVLDKGMHTKSSVRPASACDGCAEAISLT